MNRHLCHCHCHGQAVDEQQHDVPDGTTHAVMVAECTLLPALGTRTFVHQCLHMLEEKCVTA